MFHPFRPVICFHRTAVPVLCYQLTQPEMLLVMELFIELEQSGLFFCCCVVLGEDGLILTFIPLGPAALHKGLENGRCPVFCIPFRFSVAGLHHMNFLQFLER